MNAPRCETRDARPGAARGFTLFELVVCLLVFSVLVTVLLERLAYYQELAEKAAMESTARVVKTGLQIRLAQLIVANRQAEAAELETADPVQWLEIKPVNYGGAYHGAASPGTWYFDEQARQLVYLVLTGDRLKFDGQTGHKQVRYRVRLLKDRISVAGGPVTSVTGVTLAVVTPYYWP
jgi:prepilin-type N-terminal cleavage/methylation domain-containing protein